jgi:hypothetical protein
MKIVIFVFSKISYIALRGGWCDIFLNALNTNDN